MSEGKGPQRALSEPSPNSRRGLRVSAPSIWVRLVANLAVGAGSLLVAGSAALHFYLWDSEGFRNVPTIGPLFLTQAIVGWVLAIATVTSRRLLFVLASAGYGVVSACALIYSILFGMFGWQERLGAPYVGLALAIEFSAGAVLLGAAAVLVHDGHREARLVVARASRLHGGER